MRVSRKILILTGVLTFMVMFTISCAKQEEAGQFLNDQGYWEISVDGITLQWKVEGSSLNVILSAPTSGWVAVGFDPDNRMQGTNFILGYVSGGSVTLRDDYGNTQTSHISDISSGGSDDFTNPAGTEIDNTTEIRFTIPLDSGDQYDKTLVQDNTYTVLLAYGNVDDLTEKHIKRTSIKITL